MDRGFSTTVGFAEVVAVGKTEGSDLDGDGIPCLVTRGVGEFTIVLKAPEEAVLDSLISHFQDDVARGAKRGDRRDSTVETSVTWVSLSSGREAWDGPITMVLVIGGGGTK